MSNIKYTEYSMRTSVPVKDVALAFRNAVNYRVPGIKGRLSPHNALDWSFFTPDSPNDPFASVEESDDPAFEVGAQFGAKEKARMTTVTQVLADANSGWLLLSVWDRGDYREATLRLAGNPGQSKIKVDLFVSEMRTADPDLELSSSKGKMQR